MAWPRALHGISIVHLGQCHYTALKAGAMKSLRVNRIGANPSLHLMTHGASCDPEGWAILQTFRELREVGSCDQMQAMLSFAAQGCPLPPNGPASILLSRVERLGWRLTRGGQIEDRFGIVDLFGLSWQAVVDRVHWSWPRLVAAEVSHRKSFAGIQYSSISEVRRVLSGLGTADQSTLRCCLNGTMYHDIKKQKHQRGTGSLCLHCGSLDSVFHRVWECTHFASCRSGFRFWSQLSLLPACLSCHGWPLQPPSWSALIAQFLAIPPVDSVVSWPSVGQQPFHLFIDGTCAFPREPMLRYASWGVTLAQFSPSLFDHQILACGHVRGQLQTAYRGELEAMVFALRAVAKGGVAAIIWSDCNAVIRRTQRLLNGGVVKPNSPHADLWMIVAGLVSDGALSKVSLQKVMSHGDVGLATSGIEQWAFGHNALVDAAVGKYNQKRSVSFMQAWHRVQFELGYYREVHSDCVDVLLRVGRHAMEQRKQTEAGVEEVQDFSTETHPVGPDAGWHLGVKLERLYLSSNMQVLHDWWCQVGSPLLQAGQRSRTPLRWVAGIQLYCDFWLTTRWEGFLSPVHGRWFDSPTSAPPGTPIHLGGRSTMFLRAWKAYLKHNGVVIPCGVHRPWSYVINYWTQCYRLQWSQKRLELVDKALLSLQSRQFVKPVELQKFHLVDFAADVEWL